MWGLKRIIFVVRLIAVNDTLFDGSIVGMQASQACSGIFHYSGGKMVRCSVLMYTGKKEGGSRSGSMQRGWRKPKSLLTILLHVVRPGFDDPSGAVPDSH